MISTFDASSASLPLVTCNAEVSKPRWKLILSKICEIAKEVLLGIGGACLFLLNPTLFGIGFIAGIIWDDKTREILNKVKDVWKKRPIEMSIASGLGILLCPQVALAAGSLFYAGYLGARIAEHTKR